MSGFASDGKSDAEKNSDITETLSNLQINEKMDNQSVNKKIDVKTGVSCCDNTEELSLDMDFIKWNNEAAGTNCFICDKPNTAPVDEDNVCEKCCSQWKYDEEGEKGEGYYKNKNPAAGNASTNDVLYFCKCKAECDGEGSYALDKKDTPKTCILNGEPNICDCKCPVCYCSPCSDDEKDDAPAPALDNGNLPLLSAEQRRSLTMWRSVSAEKRRSLLMRRVVAGGQGLYGLGQTDFDPRYFTLYGNEVYTALFSNSAPKVLNNIFSKLDDDEFIEVISFRLLNPSDVSVGDVYDTLFLFECNILGENACVPVWKHDINTCSQFASVFCINIEYNILSDPHAYKKLRLDYKEVAALCFEEYRHDVALKLKRKYGEYYARREMALKKEGFVLSPELAGLKKLGIDKLLEVLRFFGYYRKDMKNSKVDIKLRRQELYDDIDEEFEKANTTDIKKKMALKLIASLGVRKSPEKKSRPAAAGDAPSPAPAPSPSPEYKKEKVIEWLRNVDEEEKVELIEIIRRKKQQIIQMRAEFKLLQKEKTDDELIGGMNVEVIYETINKN